MAKVKKFTFLVEMPAIFSWYEYECGYRDIDMVNNPDGVYETHLLNFFWGMYGPNKWCDDVRFSSLPEIEPLLLKYNYKFKHEFKNAIKKDKVTIEFIVHTDALGQHLEAILEACYDELTNDHGSFSMAMKEAKFQEKGWQNISKKDLVKCEHTNVTRLQIMNDKDGSIVEVCECQNPKCKELIKRVI